MTVRHPLDGNAIAADRYYGEDFPSPECSLCGEWFEDEVDDRMVERSRAYRDLCADCADMLGDEP